MLTVASRAGQRAVREWHKAGGVTDDERPLSAAPVLNLSQRSFGSINGGAATVKDERGPGMDIYIMFWVTCVWLSSVRGDL